MVLFNFFQEEHFFSSNSFKENILETNPIVPVHSLTVQRTVKETAMMFFLCYS